MALLASQTQLYGVVWNDCVESYKKILLFKWDVLLPKQQSVSPNTQQECCVLVLVFTHDYIIVSIHVCVSV